MQVCRQWPKLHTKKLEIVIKPTQIALDLLVQAAYRTRTRFHYFLSRDQRMRYVKWVEIKLVLSLDFSEISEITDPLNTLELYREMMHFSWISLKLH